MEKSIKILVADDHQLFRAGLINILSQSPDLEIVGEASDGVGVLMQLESGLACDLILLDVNMPNLNGIETMSRIKRRGISVPVLMLSMEDNEHTVIQLIKLGVKGYVLKDASPDHLKEAIRTASKNQYYLNEVLSANLSSALDGRSIDIGNGRLTEREIEFLRLCATELTYKEIAKAMDIGPRTVDNYRDALFDKLHVKNRIGLVLWAFKNGLIQINGS